MGLWTYHVSVASRDTIARHCPEQRVQRCRLLAEEVPCGVVCSRTLRHLPVRSRLDTVDEIRKLNSILDEEDRNVVANNVKVAFVGVAGVTQWLVLADTQLLANTSAEGEPFHHEKLTIL